MPLNVYAVGHFPHSDHPQSIRGPSLASPHAVAVGLIVRIVVAQLHLAPSIQQLKQSNHMLLHPESSFDTMCQQLTSIRTNKGFCSVIWVDNGATNMLRLDDARPACANRSVLQMRGSLIG